MNVFLVNLHMFAESATTALALLAVAVLLVEYSRRRQAHLLLFAAGFAATAVAYAVSFAGKLATGLGHDDVGISLILAFRFLIVIPSVMFLLGLADAFVVGKRRSWAFAGALAVGAFSVVTMFVTGAEVIKSVGTPLLAIPEYQQLPAGLSSIALFATLLLIGKTSKERRSNQGRLETYLNLAGLTGFVGMTVYCLRAIAAPNLTEPLAILLGIPMLCFIALAATAKGHPDPRVVALPSLYIRSRVTVKAVVLNTLLFLILGYSLVILTASYFVAASRETRENALIRDAYVFSRTYASGAALFLEETSRLAADPDLAELLKNDSASAELIESLGREGAMPGIVRLADRDGVVLYSSFSPDEVGRLIESTVLRKALAGLAVASTEREEALQMWVLRAASPVSLPDGSVVGVMLTTDLRRALDFSDYTAISPLNASGYGYVTETGELAFSSGEEIDMYTKSVMTKRLGIGRRWHGPIGNGDEVFLERAFGTDGSSSGYFYVTLSTALMARDAFAILSTVSLFIHLALLIVLIIQAFSTSVMLRPIVALRKAVAGVAEGRYDVELPKSSQDEVGDLVQAIGGMSTAIATRTSDLQKSIREQQDFLDHAINDLRTPVNVFRWTLEMMRFGEVGDLNGRQLEFLEQMHQTNERLVRLVQNLRDVSRLDHGRFALRTEFLAIEDLVDEAAGELAVDIRQRNINLHWKRPKAALPHVRADRGAVKKILNTLISNAVKYNQNNGHIEVLVSRASADRPGGKSGKYLVISIEDSGRGIPPGDHSRVFERFYRSKSVVAEEIEGSGLGLHVAKRLTELMGGAIWFESKENVGTTFSFSLPADDKA